MIRIFLLLFCLAFGYGAVAQSNDTSAYLTQRLKINSLLADRSARFGQYDLSLNARTGIFGLQTKQDLKNSNEILRAIILNDNNIFRELKILMNYKDQQVQQVQSNATNTKKRIAGYMLSIKNLQEQNDILRERANKVEAKSSTSTYIIILLSLIIVGGGIFFYTKLKQSV